MGDIEVRRERKRRRDRLIAADLDGTELGSMNLATGEVDILVPERASEIATALNQWSMRDAGPPSRDFARNRPGALARRQAKLARPEIRRRTRAGVRGDIGAPSGAQVPTGIGVRSEETTTFLNAVKGEERIARVLRRLKGTGWHVLHSILLPGGGDIDHLLVGADGVVVISTRYHRGAKLQVTKRDIYVDDARTDYLDQVRDEAGEASRLLSQECGFRVTAIPCVALVNGGLFQPRLLQSGKPKDVIVATNWNLPRALGDAGQGLGEDQVEAIYEAARRSTTWEG
ncbi:MAG: NERD domain-containing protein [Demequinaceae bacterium]|nr:NERD domain-containing protein [Demequinaceae bacterium]